MKRVIIKFTETIDYVFDQVVSDDDLDHILDRHEISDFDEIKKKSKQIDGFIESEALQIIAADDAAVDIMSKD